MKKNFKFFPILLILSFLIGVVSLVPTAANAASVGNTIENILDGKTFTAADRATATHSGSYNGSSVKYDYTKLTDGDMHLHTGRFSTNSSNSSQVFDGIVDLRGGYSLGELLIYDFNPSSSAAPFMGTALEIQTYSEGVWTTVVSCASNDEIISHRVGSSYLLFDLSDTRAEQIRIYIPARLGTNSISMYEIKCSGVLESVADVFDGKIFEAGDRATPFFVGTHGGVSVNYDYTKLTDNNTHYQTGRFSTKSSDASQVFDGIIDLGGGFFLDELKINDFNSTATTAPFMGTALEIQAYSLGKWTTVVKCESNDEIVQHRLDSTNLLFDLGGVRAEKVRIYIPARLGTNSISINEIECSATIDDTVYNYFDNLLLGKSFVPTESAAKEVHVDPTYDYGYPVINDGSYAAKGGRFSTRTSSLTQHVDATVYLDGVYQLGELRIYDFNAHTEPNASEPGFLGPNLTIEAYIDGEWHTVLYSTREEYGSHRVSPSNAWGAQYLSFNLSGVTAEMLRIYIPSNIDGNSISFYEITCSGNRIADHTAHIGAEAVKENNVLPTCADKGSYDNVVYCAVCGLEMSRETVPVDKLNHTYKPTVTEPDCVNGGYTTYTCSACGDSYKGDETSALGHIYDGYTCINCGHTTRQVIDLSDLQWNWPNDPQYPENTIIPVYNGEAYVVYLTCDYFESLGLDINDVLVFELEGHIGVDAGDYIAVIKSVALNDNYKDRFVLAGTDELPTLHWFIDPSLINISDIEWTTTTSFVYDGNVHSVELISYPESLIPIYTCNAATDAGEYVANVTFVNPDENVNNYKIVGEAPTCTWEITPVEIDTSMFVWSNNSFVFDGNNHFVCLLDLPSYIEVCYSGDASAFNAGEYTTIATLNVSVPNYTLTEDTLVCEWTILPYCFDVSNIGWTNTEGFVYNGSEYLVRLDESTIPSFVNVTYVVDGIDTGIAINAGQYKTVALLTVDSNYMLSAYTVEINWSIAPQQVDLSTLTWMDGDIFEYTGNYIEMYLTNIPKYLAVTYENSIGTNVGTYITTAHVTSNSNYKLVGTVEPKTWSITAVYIDTSDINWIYDAPFTYNGGEFEVTLINLPEGVAVVSATGNIAINAGIYVAVIEIAPIDPNYLVTESTFTLEWVINKAAIDGSSLKLENVTITYDGQAYNLAVSGNEDILALLNITYSETDMVEVGTYNVTATITVKSEYEGNYTFYDELDATLTITAPEDIEPEPTPDPEPTPEPDDDTTDDVIPEPEKDHSECETNDIFTRILNMIINFFRSLLGLPEKCICGEELK